MYHQNWFSKKKKMKFGINEIFIQVSNKTTDTLSSCFHIYHPSRKIDNIEQLIFILKQG